MRHIMNAIFYLLKTGYQWGMLPQDFSPWGTVHYYFRRWRLEEVWFKIHEQLGSIAGKKHQKDEHPTAGIMDSQSLKTTEKRGSIDIKDKGPQPPYWCGYFGVCSVLNHLTS